MTTLQPPSIMMFMIYTYYNSKVNYQLANSTQHTCGGTSSDMFWNRTAPYHQTNLETHTKLHSLLLFKHFFSLFSQFQLPSQFRKGCEFHIFNTVVEMVSHSHNVIIRQLIVYRTWWYWAVYICPFSVIVVNEVVNK